MLHLNHRACFTERLNKKKYFFFARWLLQETNNIEFEKTCRTMLSEELKEFSLWLKNENNKLKNLFIKN